jgi:hypothetical protein
MVGLFMKFGSCGVFCSKSDFRYQLKNKNIGSVVKKIGSVLLIGLGIVVVGLALIIALGRAGKNKK